MVNRAGAFVVERVPGAPARPKAEAMSTRVAERHNLTTETPGNEKRKWLMRLLNWSPNIACLIITSLSAQTALLGGPGCSRQVANYPDQLTRSTHFTRGTSRPSALISHGTGFCQSDLKPVLPYPG
jgi:hypothetical protein